MQLQLRDISDPGFENYAVRAGEEIMIYGFIVKMTLDLNLLDFFHRFLSYMEENNMEIYDSFQFTKWLMENERVAVQEVGVTANINEMRKFWDFQKPYLPKLETEESTT